MRAILAVLLLVAGCAELAPLKQAPGVPEQQAPGVANVRTPRDLLPQRVDRPWELVERDLQPGPAQYDAWATELVIAVVFEAAVAVAQYDGKNVVRITAFQSDSGVDGPSFARSWTTAYACNEPDLLAIAGVTVTRIRAQANCRPHYLLVFRDQLVVIHEDPDEPHLELEPSDFEPLVRAIMEQAE